jgi:hypothetical protein
MKKIVYVIALAAILMSFCLTTAFAAGGKEHGDVGQGSVKQCDPVGPGDQPDWQDQ